MSERAICVCDGLISDIGSVKRVIERNPGVEIVYGDRFLITPAFIDAHDHGRGISPFGFGAPDDSLELWLQDLWKLPPISPYIATLYDGLNLADAGVATVLHSHNTVNRENLEEELVDVVHGYNDAGIRVALCPPYMNQNKGIYTERADFIESLPEKLGKEFASTICDCPMTLDDYFALVDRLLVRLKPQIEKGMAQIQLHPVGGQWCSDDVLLRMKSYALAHNMRIHLHLLETKYQKYFAEKTWGCSFIKHYNDIGFLGPWLSFAHMVWIDAEDIRLLSEKSAMLVTNPSSNYRLRSGSMPLLDVLKSGITCGLGLDGCAFDDDQDYIRELRVAKLNSVSSGVNGLIGTEAVLNMATASGTAITGEALSSGRLAVGLPADFICFDLDKLESPYASSDISPLDLILQRGTKQMIDAVYVSGVQVSGRGAPFITQRQDAKERLLEELKDWRPKPPTSAQDKLIAAIHDFYEKWESEA